MTDPNQLAAEYDRGYRAGRRDDCGHDLEAFDRQARELAELRAEVSTTRNALVNARAVASDRIADRDKICRDVMAERDEWRRAAEAEAQGRRPEVIAALAEQASRAEVERDRLADTLKALNGGSGHAVMQVAQKALVVAGARLLMVRYGATGNHDWDLPGGRVEAGEVDLDLALAREVKEETGLTATVGPPVAAYIAAHSATGRATLFVIREVQAVGTVTSAGQVPEDDIAEVCWVPLPEVTARNLNPCLDVERVLAALDAVGTTQPQSDEPTFFDRRAAQDPSIDHSSHSQQWVGSCPECPQDRAEGER